MLNNLEFTLYLIRHGQSEVNVNPDIIGQTATTPLTDHGRFQAKLLHNRLKRLGIKFDFIFSSHYDRALETAKISIPDPNQQIILAPAIREYSAGDWIGKSRKNLISKEMAFKMKDLNLGFLPPNGESFNMVERRSSEWLDNEIVYNPQIIDHYNKHGPVIIGAYSHGMTIKSLLHYVCNFDKNFVFKIKIDNTSITKLSFDNQGWRLLGVNDIAHLEV